MAEIKRSCSSIRNLLSSVNSKFLNLPQFSRDAKLLVIVSGIFSISFFGIYTLLRVLYILRLGHGPEYVGLFGATGALIYTGMGLPSGAIGSRFEALKIMLIGSVITVLGMAILPLTEFVPFWIRYFWPLLSQIVLTVGWSMFNTNLVPVLMSTTTETNRNNIYALNSALRGLGAFLGALSGGMLPGLFARILHQTLEDPGPYRISLWIGAFVSLIAFVTLIFVKQSKNIESEQKRETWRPFPLLFVSLMTLCVYLSRVGWSATRAFGNAYMDTDLHLTASSIGLITCIGQFVAAFSPFLAPRLAAYRSNGWTITVTTLGIAISILPFALIPHWAAVGLGRLGILSLSAIWMPALQVFQMELVDEGWRSLAYGATSMAMGFSFGSVSLIGGYIVVASGYQSLFLIGTFGTVLGTALMWILYRFHSSLCFR
jgi:MFS family permease